MVLKCKHYITCFTLNISQTGCIVASSWDSNQVCWFGKSALYPLSQASQLIELRLYTIFLHNPRPEPSIYCSATPACGYPQHTTQRSFFRKTRSLQPEVWLQCGNVYHLKIPSNLETTKNEKERGPKNMPVVEKYPIWGLWWKQRLVRQYVVMHYRGSTQLFLTSPVVWIWSCLWDGEWYWNIVVDLQYISFQSID